jgi:hypothetical protein
LESVLLHHNAQSQSGRSGRGAIQVRQDLSLIVENTGQHPQNALMEAGPDYENQSATPADLLDSKNLAGPAHDWGYKAIPVEGRIIPYQRGKVVGQCCRA